MKRKITVILISTIIIVAIILLAINKTHNVETKGENNQIQGETSNENTVLTENAGLDEKVDSTENTEVEELKQQYNITGNNEIYNVETEKDGRKVINVKPSINFKVAFAGMIKKQKPSFEEIDSIFENNAPNQKGIWIKKENREKILNYLNDNSKCKYEINNDGYLQITDSTNANATDKKIQKLINGEKQYIICISSTCYMVDTVTGEIVDNPYNELDAYQSYEYFKDEDRMIIFITENKNSKMTEKEIFESIINLIEVSGN